tara:strand:+ start:954 stop:1556 length:603 start_codon:yes stop_codon:yes gene_type:complete
MLNQSNNDRKSKKELVMTGLFGGVKGEGGNRFFEPHRSKKAISKEQAYQNSLALVEDVLDFLQEGPVSQKDKPGNVCLSDLDEIGDEKHRNQLFRNFIEGAEEMLQDGINQQREKSSKGLLGIGASKNKAKDAAFQPVINAFNKLSYIWKGKNDAQYKPHIHKSLIKELVKALEGYKKFLQGKLGVDPDSTRSESPKAVR